MKTAPSTGQVFPCSERVHQFCASVCLQLALLTGYEEVNGREPKREPLLNRTGLP